MRPEKFRTVTILSRVRILFEKVVEKSLSPRINISEFQGDSSEETIVVIGPAYPTMWSKRGAPGGGPVRGGSGLLEGVRLDVIRLNHGPGQEIPTQRYQ